MGIWMCREFFAQDLAVFAHFLGVSAIDVFVDVVLQHAIQEVAKVEILDIVQIVADGRVFASHHPVFVVAALRNVIWHVMGLHVKLQKARDALDDFWKVHRLLFW